MNPAEAQEALYVHFSRIAKAASNPRRIELLELLGQTERSVEELAEATGMEVGNTSAQLQVLARVHLVESRRDGKRIYYRVADDAVFRFLAVLRGLARARLPEVEQVARDYFEARNLLEPVSRSELRARVEQFKAHVIDVRPAREFAAGHIPGAISVPLDELTYRLDELPRESEIVAYCRGQYCILAPQAVEILRSAGFRARRLEEGFPEWRLSGLPVEAGTAV